MIAVPEAGRTLFGLAVTVSGALVFVPFTVAGLSVALRRAGNRNMLPAIAVGQLVGVLLAAPFADFEPLGAGQMGWLLISGLVILPLGVGLLSLGPRYISAPEVAMILGLEMVSSPFLAVVAHALWRLRTPPRLQEAL